MSTQLQPSLAGLSGMARRLVSEGVLPEAEVRKAMADSAQQKASLMGWMLDHNLVEGIQLTQIASAEFGMPMMDVASINPKSMPLDLISEALISKHQALPLFRRGKRLFVGIADPMQSHALDEIKFHSNCMVEPILVERGSLQRVIESLLNSMRDTMPDMGGGELDEHGAGHRRRRGRVDRHRCQCCRRRAGGEVRQQDSGRRDSPGRFGYPLRAVRDPIPRASAHGWHAEVPSPARR